MRKSILAALVLALASGSAQATLFNRDGSLIYDDVLHVTWLQDANYAKTSSFDADGGMNWNFAQDWVNGLVFGGFDDWRLPKLTPINGTSMVTVNTNNATTDRGTAKTGLGSGWNNGSGVPVSELGYMYYVNLEMLGDWIPNDSDPTSQVTQPGHEVLKQSPFFNIQPNRNYWFGPVDFPGSGFDSGDYPTTGNRWMLRFPLGDGLAGYQTLAGVGNDLYSWPVRDGDVLPIPEPTTLAILGLGLAGLGAMRRRRAV